MSHSGGCGLPDNRADRIVLILVRFGRKASQVAAWDKADHYNETTRAIWKWQDNRRRWTKKARIQNTYVLSENVAWSPRVKRAQSALADLP